MAKGTTEVAAVEEQEYALSTTGYDYGDEAGEGFEGISLNDMSIPFLNLLQSNSPEVEAQTIPNARAGLILNSVTKEILDQPIIVQPVKREHKWVEWKPRTAGGGLVATHEDDSEVVKKAIAANGGSRIPPKGNDGKRVAMKVGTNELVETFYYYCFLLDPNGMEQIGWCVISFSSTKIKVQKDWMTAMRTQRGKPPLKAFRCKIATERQTNDSGQPYYNFTIRPFGDTWIASSDRPAVWPAARFPFH